MDHDPLIEAYQRQTTWFRLAAAAAVVPLWDALDQYDRRDIDDLVGEAAAAVEPARQAIIPLALGFVTLLLNDTPRATVVELGPQLDVWKMPFHATWHALAEGRPFTEAVDAGRSQAEAVARDQVTHAERAAFVAADADQRITKWRRVPNASACAWCKTIAQQHYRTAATAGAAHHDRCSCSVVPVIN